LCSDKPAATGADGTVSTDGWLTTALGALGIGGGNGNIADKILVVGTKVAGS